MIFPVGYTKPYDRLVKQRPHGSLMAPAMIASIFSQMLIVIAFQTTAIHYLQYQTWWESPPPPISSAAISFWSFFFPFFFQKQTRYDPISNYTGDEDPEKVTNMEATTIFLVAAFQDLILAFVYSKGPPYRKRVFTNGTFSHPSPLISILPHCFPFFSILSPFFPILFHFSPFFPHSFPFFPYSFPFFVLHSRFIPAFTVLVFFFPVLFLCALIFLALLTGMLLLYAPWERLTNFMSVSVFLAGFPGIFEMVRNELRTAGNVLIGDIFWIVFSFFKRMDFRLKRTFFSHRT